MRGCVRPDGDRRSGATLGARARATHQEAQRVAGGEVPAAAPEVGQRGAQVGRVEVRRDAQPD